MKSELKRLAIQKGALSDADKKLAEEFCTPYSHGEFSYTESELAALLAKVREDERKRCNALHDDVLAPIGNSSYGEAYQDGWIAGTSAYREAIGGLK